MSSTARFNPIIPDPKISTLLATDFPIKKYFEVRFAPSANKRSKAHTFNAETFILVRDFNLAFCKYANGMRKRRQTINVKDSKTASVLT